MDLEVFTNITFLGWAVLVKYELYFCLKGENAFGIGDFWGHNILCVVKVMSERKPTELVKEFFTILESFPSVCCM